MPADFIPAQPVLPYSPPPTLNGPSPVLSTYILHPTHHPITFRHEGGEREGKESAHLIFYCLLSRHYIFKRFILQSSFADGQVFRNILTLKRSYDDGLWLFCGICCVILDSPAISFVKIIHNIIGYLQLLDIFSLGNAVRYLFRCKCSKQ